MTIFTSPLADVVIPEISITERLFQAFDSRPDRVVMIDGPTGREVTARAMMASIRTLAGGLTAQGFGAGQVVALMAPNMPEFCTVFHGVAYAGGTITTINPAVELIVLVRSKHSENRTMKAAIRYKNFLYAILVRCGHAHDKKTR